MSKRKSARAVPARKRADAAGELRKTLASQRKAELVNALLELAQADRGVLRRLTARFEVATAPEELLAATRRAIVAATRRAIVQATAFDERDINRNFAYDYGAYREVKRNLARLIASGKLRPAMKLALQLMKQGSHQVEMSDEGLMTDDLEDCLSVVLQALRKCALPADEISAWCSAMLEHDRVGFIAREPLEALLNRFQAATR